MINSDGSPKQKLLFNKKFWEELIAYFPWKRRVQQFFFRVCIRYRGNVSTKPLSSNGRETLTDPLPGNDRGYTDIHIYRQHRDLINLLYFFQNRKAGWKYYLDKFKPSNVKDTDRHTTLEVVTMNILQKKNMRRPTAYWHSLCTRVYLPSDSTWLCSSLCPLHRLQLNTQHNTNGAMTVQWNTLHGKQPSYRGSRSELNSPSVKSACTDYKQLTYVLPGSEWTPHPVKYLFCMQTNVYICRLWISHSGGHDESYLLRYDAE
jgi:hypothetical protein